MGIIITGMRRQINNEDARSVRSQIGENDIPNEGWDFFEDDSNDELKESSKKK